SQCLTIDTCGLARHSGIGHCAIGQVPVREAFGRVHARWEDKDRRCLLAAVGVPSGCRRGAVGLRRSGYGQVRAFLYVGERPSCPPIAGRGVWLCKRCKRTVSLSGWAVRKLPRTVVSGVLVPPVNVGIAGHPVDRPAESERLANRLATKNRLLLA